MYVWGEVVLIFWVISEKTLAPALVLGRVSRKIFLPGVAGWRGAFGELFWRRLRMLLRGSDAESSDEADSALKWARSVTAFWCTGRSSESVSDTFGLVVS